ncbi:uncharacterized protein LOC111057891 isoform X2 [Nilaparvata lugens]|uniref:uncharacterized protein LOC111057891 isoform X2 n=1 Tax=Nilaparvata lugens TaxID=108931 RepID=UPI000B97E6DF|nr:uncharacterized protein LOC111057891 isoform X2 [Nilaparvata lugens]
MYSASCLASAIFFILLTSCVSKNEEIKPTVDFLLCRQCGTDLASANTIVSYLSPAAEGRKNVTLFGLQNVLLQTLRNPLNIKFQVITLTKANCIGTGHWNVDDSWFPGYAWKTCLCTHCNNHLGWLFEPIATAHNGRQYTSSKGFYALILDNVISEFYSNSLLATPKHTFHIKKQHQDL